MGEGLVWAGVGMYQISHMYARYMEVALGPLSHEDDASGPSGNGCPVPHDAPHPLVIS